MSDDHELDSDDIEFFDEEELEPIKTEARGIVVMGSTTTWLILALLVLIWLLYLSY